MNKYWFRKRRGLMSKDLGWGWVLISWEGYAVVGVMISAIAASGYLLGIFSSDDVTLAQGLVFLGVIFLLTLVVALISKAKTK